ncbi:MAG: DNA-formamidopyrimidine glycosylase family protein [Anaerolineae bacterium]
MPELPEIALFARDMTKELAGRTIATIEVRQPKALNVPEEAFQAALAGARIGTTRAHGKWLLTETDRGWLLQGLGMGGEILLTDRAHMPAKWRIALDLTDGATVAINHWWFGYCHFAPDPAQHPMVGKLGTHALDLSLDEFRALLAGRRGGLKALLMDQSRIAGIGNVYIQPALWRAKVHPLRPIPTLSEAEIAAVWQHLRNVLQESFVAGGASFELNLYGQKGGWDDPYLMHWVEGAPCPACGTPLQSIRTGSTPGYICPGCQRV